MTMMIAAISPTTSRPPIPIATIWSVWDGSGGTNWPVVAGSGGVAGTPNKRTRTKITTTTPAKNVSNRRAVRSKPVARPRMSIGPSATETRTERIVPAMLASGRATTIATATIATARRSQRGLRRQSKPASRPIASSRAKARARTVAAT